MNRKDTPFHLRIEEEMKPVRFNLLQMGRLNKLNRILRKRQTELWDSIEEQIPHLERQPVRNAIYLRNYELRLAIQYYILKDSQPIYIATAIIKIETRKEMAEQMNNPHFDWSVKGMPRLKEPYCFLLGQLFQQHKIVQLIPDIAIIRTTIQFGFQSSIVMRNIKWTFVFREEDDSRNPRYLPPKRS